VNAAGVVVEAVGDGARVTKAITIRNAPRMRLAGDEFIADWRARHDGIAPLVFDMAQVQANSVAVAVVLSWLATAHKVDAGLQFANLSSDFIGVVEFSGLSQMIDVGGST